VYKTYGTVTIVLQVEVTTKKKPEEKQLNEAAGWLGSYAADGAVGLYRESKAWVEDLEISLDSGEWETDDEEEEEDEDE
jgi:hypothetical protein